MPVLVHLGQGGLHLGGPEVVQPDGRVRVELPGADRGEELVGAGVDEHLLVAAERAVPSARKRVIESPCVTRADESVKTLHR